MVFHGYVYAPQVPSLRPEGILEKQLYLLQYAGIQVELTIELCLVDELLHSTVRDVIFDLFRGLLQVVNLTRYAELVYTGRCAKIRQPLYIVVEINGDATGLNNFCQAVGCPAIASRSHVE